MTFLKDFTELNMQDTVNVTQIHQTREALDSAVLVIYTCTWLI